MKDSGLKVLVDKIMTQHWDLAACRCWICEAGREAGCGPKNEYLHLSLARVKVGDGSGNLDAKTS